MIRTLAITILLFALALPSAADDDDDYADMLDARRRGAILPLAEILERLRPQIGSRILEVEFEQDDGLAVYEIYYLNPRGRRLEIEVDASTARILDMEEDD